MKKKIEEKVRVAVVCGDGVDQPQTLTNLTTRFTKVKAARNWVASRHELLAKQFNHYRGCIVTDGDGKRYPVRPIGFRTSCKFPQPS